MTQFWHLCFSIVFDSSPFTLFQFIKICLLLLPSFEPWFMGRFDYIFFYTDALLFFNTFIPVAFHFLLSTWGSLKLLDVHKKIFELSFLTIAKYLFSQSWIEKMTKIKENWFIEVPAADSLQKKLMEKKNSIISNFFSLAGQARQSFIF